MTLINATNGTIIEKGVKSILERFEGEIDFMGISSGINEKDIAILIDVF